MGRDRRQRRRRVAAVGAAGMAAKEHRDAKPTQGEEAGAQQPAPAEPSQTAAGGLSAEVIGQLKQLGELHEQNVLSDEEFASEKAKLLGAGS